MNGPNSSREFDAVHLGHIDVREHQSYTADMLDRLEPLTAITGLEDTTRRNVAEAEFGDEYLPDGLRVLADFYSEPSTIGILVLQQAC